MKSNSKRKTGISALVEKVREQGFRVSDGMLSPHEKMEEGKEKNVYLSRKKDEITIKITIRPLEDKFYIVQHSIPFKPEYYYNSEKALEISEAISEIEKFLHSPK